MNDTISLKMTRFIKAKRKKVFAAWTKPEIMKTWYAPGSMKVPNATVDFRVGGEYRVEMQGEMEGEPQLFTVSGTYREIVPDESITFTWGWLGDPSPQTLVSVSFKDVEGGTEVTLTHARFTDNASRDKHQEGWQGCLENLAKLFN
jgi:uncharacterized protein YndB with AHSA1/START domain